MAPDRRPSTVDRTPTGEREIGTNSQEPWADLRPTEGERMTTSIENARPDSLQTFHEEVPTGRSADVPTNESADEAHAGVEPEEEGLLAAPSERVMAVVMKQPLHREILYKTLGFCRERRGLTDVEQEIATYPEFKHATQNQYRLISFLADGGGLDRLELDDVGEIVTQDTKAGLSEDEIDDLVASYAFVTTEAGVAVFDELDPRRRILDLLDTMPEYLDTFARVLEFCASARTYMEIEDLLNESGLCWSGVTEDEDAVHPSYFVNNLEKAGALVWDEGWLLSDEGRAILKSIRES